MDDVSIIQKEILLGLAQVGPTVILCVIAMGLAVCYFAYDSVSTWYLGFWFVTLVGVSMNRYRVILSLSKDQSISSSRKDKLMNLATAAAGFIHGLGLFLFFPHFSIAEKSVQNSYPSNFCCRVHTVHSWV